MYHISTHDVACEFRMQVWNVLHMASWKYRTQKFAKNSLSAHHHTTLSGNIFATKACIEKQKNILNSNISPTCLQNMVNFGPPAAGWDRLAGPVWGTPANFNGFCLLASLLHRRRSTEVNQTLQMFGLLLGWHTITYIHFRGFLPLTEFCQVQNSLCVPSRSCVLLHCVPKNVHLFIFRISLSKNNRF